MGISAYKYKTRLILAIQRIQHSDVVQFYAVFCKIDRIPDLSVVGLLRFLYLSLQICSHECDNRTNEVFLCLNAEDSGGWWRENLINIPAEASPPLRVPALLDRVGGGAGFGGKIPPSLYS